MTIFETNPHAAEDTDTAPHMIDIEKNSPVSVMFNPCYYSLQRAFIIMLSKDRFRLVAQGKGGLKALGDYKTPKGARIALRKLLKKRRPKYVKKKRTKPEWAVFTLLSENSWDKRVRFYSGVPVSRSPRP